MEELYKKAISLAQQIGQMEERYDYNNEQLCKNDEYIALKEEHMEIMTQINEFESQDILENSFLFCKESGN